MDRYVYLRDVALRRDDSRQVCDCGRGGIGPHWYRPDAGCPCTLVEQVAAGPEQAVAAPEREVCGDENYALGEPPLVCLEDAGHFPVTPHRNGNGTSWQPVTFARPDGAR